MSNAFVSCPVFSCVSYHSISLSQVSCSSRRGSSCNNLAFSGRKRNQKIFARPVGAREEALAMAENPGTFLRDGESEPSSTNSVRARFEKMIKKAQDDVCAAIEAVDGHNFKEDVWSRPGGGGGISRVLQDGNVWEKAGVSVSVVYGEMPPDAYRAARAANSPNNNKKLGAIPFFAAGISSSPRAQKCWNQSLQFYLVFLLIMLFDSAYAFD